MVFLEVGMARNSLCGAVVAALIAIPTLALAEKPRLIVQITVDGFRGDLLHRYMDSFGADGFRRLIDNGVWYTDAHHMHANTETIVGHTTLSTGAHPSEHGMIGNAWFNREDGRLGYNIEDENYHMLPIPGFAGEGEQLDPTQAAAQSDGRSPVNILVSTFGDELFKSNNGRSKIVGVSGKDRSAVAMAGHVGDAYWMSTSTGAYQTSSYYHETYPKWVIDWNMGKPADAAVGTKWMLHDPLNSYVLAGNDDRPYETDLNGFGRVFPHAFGAPEDGLYYTQVLLTPLGDVMTADFAKAAVLGEGLGQDEYPDFLGVSFAGVDMANHIFGPSSLENEEMVRSLDRTLAGFMGFLDDKVGRGNVVYVLSADHGMAEMTEFMADYGMSVERNTNAQLQEELNFAVEDAFGVVDAVKAFFRPYIYLDHEAIAAAGADTRTIERLIVEDLNARTGIAIALPAVPFPEQRGDYLEGPIRRNYHPLRSGDIYVAQAPYSYLYSGGPVAAMHGSPWKYDTHVPVIFSGPGIKPAVVSRQVETVDVSVTLAAMFGTTMPSGASGQVLREVLDGH